MRSAVDDVLQESGGAATRAMLQTTLDVHALEDEIQRKRLVRLFPRAYCRPWDVDNPYVRDKAALLSVGQPSALSHTSALRLWNLPHRPDDNVHVSVPWSRNPRPQTPGIVVHHIKHPFPETGVVDGLTVVSVASALTTSWAMLRGSDQRAPVLAASRQGLVLTADIRHELRRSTRIRGRRQLLELADLIDLGCESELEIWGYLEVFDVPVLSGATRQLEVWVRGRRYRLDLAFEAERVAVELDGRAYHESPDQWERDIARDLQLATIGWQTVRLSHSRLTSDVHGCRRDVLSVLNQRQQIRRTG